MTGKRRDLMNVPPGASKVCQTEMAKCVRAESFDTGASCNSKDDRRIAHQASAYVEKDRSFLALSVS
jgi:hypothetical protein